MASQNELQSMLNAPIALAPNTYLHFYNGGKLRAEFMGEPDPKDDYYSEEWIFSTNRQRLLVERTRLTRASAVLNFRVAKLCY